jgi:hypothetical protein
MNEKRNTKNAGWLVVAAALILAGALSISGVSKPESKPQAKSTATVTAPTDGSSHGSFGSAQADSDTCDVQLD